MFWKKKKPSLEGEGHYLHETGDPCDCWDSVKEIDYLMHSPYVKQSLLETELHYKSAALLLLLREEEKLGRDRAELNGGITVMLKETEERLAVVDAALQEITRMKWERIDNESPELLNQLEAIIKKRCPEW